MAAGKKEMVHDHIPKIKKKIDKLLFASNATPASLLMLSSSNASLLCVVCDRLPEIHSEYKKTPDANTSNRNKS